MLNTGDLLLRWISEQGGGRVRDLRAGVLATGRRRASGLKEGADGRWLRDMSALGFLDIDWQGGLWSVAPPVLTRVPSSDGLAVVVGRRTAAHEDRLKHAAAEWAQVVRVPNETEDGDIPVPDTVYLQYDSANDLEEAADRLGCTFVPCAATQLSAMLPDLVLGPPAAPPTSVAVSGLERYDLDKQAYVVSQCGGDGLYRWRGADWSRFIRLRRSGEWYAVNHETGIYLELERSGVQVMRWKPEAGKGRAGVGRLAVDWGGPLPPLHARTVVLCTGLQPHFRALARTARYDNVPLAVAQSVAASLHQQLEIEQPSALVEGAQ
jgi:hypothetical protein